MFTLGTPGVGNRTKRGPRRRGSVWLLFVAFLSLRSSAVAKARLRGLYEKRETAAVDRWLSPGVAVPSPRGKRLPARLNRSLPTRYKYSYFFAPTLFLLRN